MELPDAAAPKVKSSGSVYAGLFSEGKNLFAPSQVEPCQCSRALRITSDRNNGIVRNDAPTGKGHATKSSALLVAQRRDVEVRSFREHHGNPHCAQGRGAVGPVLLGDAGRSTAPRNDTGAGRYAERTAREAPGRVHVRVCTPEEGAWLLATGKVRRRRRPPDVLGLQPSHSLRRVAAQAARFPELIVVEGRAAHHRLPRDVATVHAAATLTLALAVAAVVVGANGRQSGRDRLVVRAERSALVDGYSVGLSHKLAAALRGPGQASVEAIDALREAEPALGQKPQRRTVRGAFRVQVLGEWLGPAHVEFAAAAAGEAVVAPHTLVPAIVECHVVGSDLVLLDGRLGVLLSAAAPSPVLL